MAVDPYKQYKAAYDAQTKAISAENEAQTAERKQREQTAKADLANANRGVYTTYKNATNPYGSFASQNNFSKNISDYQNNASYGTYLKGLGSNQYNYNEAMNNSNALWNNWVAQKAGQEAQNLDTYAGRMAEQGNLDRDFNYKKERDAVADNQWQLQFDFDKDRDQYQRDRDKIGDQQWQAEFDENNRRYNQEWDYNTKGSNAGGGNGGGGNKKKGSPNDQTPDLQVPDDTNNYNSKAGAQDLSKSPHLVKTELVVVGGGRRMKKLTYSDGKVKYQLI